MEEFALRDAGLALDVEFVWRGQSSKVAGVEHGIHVHRGINGSPGAVSQFKNFGYPVVAGHPHSPSIAGDVMSVGTCSRLVEPWDPDPTTKAHAHVVQYANGMTAMATMTPDGRWRA